MSRAVPSLTPELRAAGMGVRRRSLDDDTPVQFYGENFCREASSYHREGDRWDDVRLRRFFADGLLNYYIAYFSRIDLTNNYHLIFDRNYSLLSHTEMVQLFSIASIFRSDVANLDRFGTNVLFIPQASLLEIFPKSELSQRMKDDISQYALTITTAISLMKRLTTSESLLQLGANFQRTKVICEKLTSKEDFSEHYIEQNRQAEILQTAICRWVEFYVHQIQKKCKTSPVEIIDPTTFSLECPLHILEYLTNNGIPAEQLPQAPVGHSVQFASASSANPATPEVTDFPMVPM